MTHAALSPSSAHRWTRCPASVIFTDAKEEASPYAAEGTAAHFLAAHLLNTPAHEPWQLRGARIAVDEAGESRFLDPDFRPPVELLVFEVDDDMLNAVTRHVDYVSALRQHASYCAIEQRLDISDLTGEKDAHGVADAILVVDGELIIVDYKHGRGVEVEAEDNDQLAIYALAAFDALALTHDIDRARLVIVQPRVDPRPKEWTIPLTGARSLENYRRALAAKAHRCRCILLGDKTDEKDFAPDEKACRWCRGAAECTALYARVIKDVAGDFAALPAPDAVQKAIADVPSTTLDTLGERRALVPLVRMWCDAVETRVHSALLDGQAVPGWKLVAGRKGARAWRNDAEAEAAMRAMRIAADVMYAKKLVTAPQAEKAAKAGDIGPRQWPKLAALIHQPEARPVVAPESDARPAYSPTAAVAADFESVAPCESV